MKRSLQHLAANTIGRYVRNPFHTRTVILCYHSVHSSFTFSTQPFLFERHLRWIKDNCDVIAFGDAVPSALKRSDRPSVIITFDDGYRDNYDIAYPLLQQYGLTATFFLTTGFLNGQCSVTEHLAAGWRTTTSEICPMEWSQIRDLIQNGMTVGSHTCTHPALGKLEASRVKTELIDSKATLEDRLGTEISAIAYPYGHPGTSVTKATVRLTAEAGYQNGALILNRSVRSTEHPLQLPRFVVDKDSVQVISQKVTGYWDLLGMRRERLAQLSAW